MRGGRNPALDGVRGVAITLVVCVHCFGWPQGGQLGVDLFFVLSGFLISTLLIEELAETGAISLRGFYSRRARRLLPALGILVAADLLTGAARGHNNLEAATISGFYLTNLVEAFGPLHGPMSHSGLDHLWSLAQEEQFYLVWPLILPFVARARRPVRALLLAIGVLCVYRFALAIDGATHTRLYDGPDTHADGLLAGAAIAFLLLRRPSFRINPFMVAIAVPVAVEALLVREPTVSWDALFLPAAEASCAAILLGALTLPLTAKIVSWRPLPWLGRISYSLYLWHYMLLWAFNTRHTWFVAAVSVLIAYVSTRWIEEPIRKRRWGKITAKVEAAVVPAGS